MITNLAVQKALKKRQKSVEDSKQFSLEEHLFPEQLAFVKDPSLNKVAVCSRRAGKSVACAADLVYTAINNPGTVCLYITLSRNNAKKIIWREIKALNREHKLMGLENLSELSVTFSNGSIIYLSGAKDSNEIEKFRGLALKLVYIDEAQSFREYIRELINDVLSPALMDYSGTLCLIGTPGPIPSGFFHDCYTKGNTWSKHHWTFWDNPFIIKKSKVSHKVMLERELARRGVSQADPSIQREYFGRFVIDSDSLLIHYDALKNHYTELPPANYDYIMGIDLGFKDADAIAVIAWSESHSTTYLVEELIVAGQGMTELVEQIKFLEKKYNVSKMVIDEGGLGKKMAEEMRRRHGVPVHAADKVRKMENIAFLNDHLRSGRFKAKSGSRFAEDSYLVEVDRDKSTPDKIKVSDKYHSDIIDSVLYAFRESPGWTFEPQKQAPKWGTKEWADAQGDEMFSAELEGLKNEKQQSSWIYDQEDS